MDTDQTENNNLISEFADVAKELVNDWDNWINKSGVTLKSK